VRKKNGERNNSENKIAGSRRAGNTGAAGRTGTRPAQFNERTKELNGMIVPIEISVYSDRSFTFEVKSPPAAVLLKKAANVAKGSGVPNKEKVGKVTKADVRKISEAKIKDLNAYDLDHADRIIAGTARSMGIEIVD
jgi:large subunit ribosomal protein L11